MGTRRGSSLGSAFHRNRVTFRRERRTSSTTRVLPSSRPGVVSTFRLAAYLERGAAEGKSRPSKGKRGSVFPEGGATNEERVVAFVQSGAFNDESCVDCVARGSFFEKRRFAFRNRLVAHEHRRTANEKLRFPTRRDTFPTRKRAPQTRKDKVSVCTDLLPMRRGSLLDENDTK